MKKILVIDDEESFAQMVKLNLEGTKEYEVRIETKGEQALDAAKEFKPDLVLLDIMMPNVDGGEVASRIKSDEDLKNTPVVFVTATVTAGEVDSRGGVIGGYPFISKPVTVEKLVECIEGNLT